MALVLDASVALAWCFRDELNEYARRALAEVADGGAVSPSVWPLEVANGLLVAERRGRLTLARALEGVDLLSGLPVDVDGVSAREAFTHVLGMARDLGLTSYDASYVELAARTGLPLATQDARLRAAAERIGVALFA